MITLELGTKKPINGIEIARQVTQLTEGLWKPSPGSIYYLLNELKTKGLLSMVTVGKNPPFDYVTTRKGQETLSTFSKRANEIAAKQMTFVKMTLQFSGEKASTVLADILLQALNVAPQTRARIVERIQPIFAQLKTE